MKKTDVYEISIKLFGLYLIIPVINFLRDVIGSLVYTSQNPFYNAAVKASYFASALLLLLLFVIQFLFIFKTRSVVKLIITENDFIDSIHLSVSKKSIYEIALFLIGGLMFIWSLPDFCFSVYYYFDYSKHNLQWTPRQSQDLMLETLKIIIGISIILSADLLSNFFLRDEKRSPNKNAL